MARAAAERTVDEPPGSHATHRRAEIEFAAAYRNLFNARAHCSRLHFAIESNKAVAFRCARLLIADYLHLAHIAELVKNLAQLVLLSLQTNSTSV